MSLSKMILEIATSQIGVVESPKGSNAGKVVEMYLKSVGLGKGYPWCMAFVYWVVQEASKKTATSNPLKKTAGVLAQWNASKSMQSNSPQVGSVMIMDYGKGKGHTGFVNRIFPNGNIETIEGNTNDDGSREGHEICKRIRSISSCKGFLNFES